MAWTSARTWVAGETVTAAIGNVHWRDNFKAIGDAWTSYTVDWTGSTNPSIGNGTKTGRWMQAGKLTRAGIKIIAGSTTTFGTGTFAFSLPAAPAGVAGDAIGVAAVFDTSASTRYARTALVGVTASTVFLTSDAGVLVSATSPMTPANGDTWSIEVFYEAA